MKLSTALITTLGLALNTAYAEEIHCSNEEWSVIATGSPNLLAGTEHLCSKYQGETIDQGLNISSSYGFPNGDGSDKPVKLHIAFRNRGKTPLRVDAEQCQDMFSNLLSFCMSEIGLEDERLFKGGAVLEKGEKEGFSAEIMEASD